MNYYILYPQFIKVDIAVLSPQFFSFLWKNANPTDSM